jgi:DNA-binding MarR family transcriptional regulator
VILGEAGTADPAKYRIDIVEFESLNVIEPKEVQAEAVQKLPEPGTRLGIAEEAVLSYIMVHGFSSRKKIAAKLTGEGVAISTRSVTRVLKSLAEKGFLRKVGNVYEPTDSAKSRPRQDTL